MIELKVGGYAVLAVSILGFAGSAIAVAARNDKVYQAVQMERAGALDSLTENPQIDALAARARAIYGEIGKTIEFSGNGGASESALAMSEGTPALDGLGLVGGDFHTDHEWIDLHSVTPRMYLFTRLLMGVGANPPRRNPAPSPTF
jgi:acetylornithine deacetylase/succinyl-diaminopimelate desuccinylase-like protein